MDNASCRVTMRPSVLNRGGCRFSTSHDRAALDFSTADAVRSTEVIINVGGVIGSCTTASRSPLLSASSKSRHQTWATPVRGATESGDRAQPAGNGVTISKVGLQLVEDRQHELAIGPEERLQGA